MLKEKDFMVIDTAIDIDFLEKLPEVIKEDIRILERAFEAEDSVEFACIWEGMECSARACVRENILTYEQYNKLIHKYCPTDCRVQNEMEESIKIWLDDLRPIPEGYIGAKSVNEAITLIETIEGNNGKIEVLDLDHDLGDYAFDGGDAIKLLDYLVENEKFYPIKIHTANPVGRDNMLRMINRYWLY